MRTYTLYEITKGIMKDCSFSHLEDALETIDTIGDYIDEPEAYELYAVTFLDEEPEDDMPRLPFTDRVVGLELVTSGVAVPRRKRYEN